MFCNTDDDLLKGYEGELWLLLTLARRSNEVTTKLSTILTKKYISHYVCGYGGLLGVIKSVISEVAETTVQSLSDINSSAPWLVWKQTETASLVRSRTGTSVRWLGFTLAQKVWTGVFFGLFRGVVWIRPETTMNKMYICVKPSSHWWAALLAKMFSVRGCRLFSLHLRRRSADALSWEQILNQPVLL